MDINLIQIHVISVYVGLKKQMNNRVKRFDIESMTATELNINKSYFQF